MFAVTTVSNAAASGIELIVTLLVIIVNLAGLWLVFEKAHRPGWYAIIPILNFVTLCHITGRSGWFAIFFFIPFVNAIIDIIVMYGLAKTFGRGIGFTIGLVLLAPIFLLILGLDRSQYRLSYAA